MTGPEPLLDPTGQGERAAGTTLTPRLRSLRGLTAGLLDNTKPNAAVLLSDIAGELQSRYGVQASVMHAKGYFGTPAEQSLIGWKDTPMHESSGGGGADRPAEVDAALQKFRDVLAADGYQLDWSLSPAGRVTITILAGPDACADCLVPLPVMEAIMADALGPTPYALGHIELPAHA